MTPREWDILTALAYFGTVKAARAHLGMARNTIHNHLRSIYGKLGANHATHAVWLTWRKGLAERYDALDRSLRERAA